MKKIAGMDNAVTTEGGINPEVVFNDDALLLNYLNALLSSVPTVKQDSGEMHFVHRAIEAGWKIPGITNAAGDTALDFETERVKMEAEVLGIENKNLKFKNEFAKINTQVLRSENDNLKAKITFLKAQLDETECTLDAMMTENSELTSRMELLQQQLNMAIMSAKNGTPHVHADPVLNADKATEKEMYPEHDFPHCDSDVPADQNEEPEWDSVVQQDVVTCEATSEISQDPVMIVQKPRTDDKTASGIAPDIAFISRADGVNDRPKQKVAHAEVIISRNRVVADTPIQRTKPVSNVIKQQHVMKYQSHQEPAKVVKVPSLEPARHEKTVMEAERKPDYVQELHVMAPETRHEDGPVSNTDSLNLDVTDEIVMEPAPAPKVVVRRNVKNYEELQNEADSKNAAKAGHTLIS